MQNVIPYTSISYWTKNTKNTKNTNEQPNTYCNAQSFIWSLKAGMLNRNFKKTVRWVMANDKAYNLMNSIKRIPTYWKKFMHELMEVVKELKGSDQTSWDPIFFPYTFIWRLNAEQYVLCYIQSKWNRYFWRWGQWYESCTAQKVSVFGVPANIRLDEDVFKTSFVFVFRRRLQDVFMTSWARPIYSPWPYVFKTSSRRFQDVLQKRLQDVLKTYGQDEYTSCKDVFKRFSRGIIKLNCFC